MIKTYGAAINDTDAKIIADYLAKNYGTVAESQKSGNCGRDALPFVPEVLTVINDRTTNWTVVPYPTPRWARHVHPQLAPEEALAEVARCHSQRIESLHALEHSLDDGRVGLELGRQVLDRRFQVAVVVEVVDNRGADSLGCLVEVREPQLPHQMVFE